MDVSVCAEHGNHIDYVIIAGKEIGEIYSAISLWCLNYLRPLKRKAQIITDSHVCRI